MSARTVLLIGILMGLVTSVTILTLLWFGVAGVLHPNATSPDWMFIFWPSSFMHVTTWRSTIPGVLITISAVVFNCLLYMVIAYGLLQLLRLFRRDNGFARHVNE